MTPENPRTESPARGLLSYFGGKSKVSDRIVDEMPTDLVRLVSPFAGGAAVEFAAAARGIEVLAYDADLLLANFWRQVTADAPAVAAAAWRWHPCTKDRYDHLVATLQTIRDPLEAAAAYYTISKACYAGKLESYGYTRQPNRRDLDQLARWQPPGPIRFAAGDWRTTIARHPTTYLYLDPPYPDMHYYRYERTTFDHHGLAAALHRHRAGWLLSYPDHPLVRRLHAGDDIRPFHLRYQTTDRPGRELIIRPPETARSHRNLTFRISFRPLRADLRAGNKPRGTGSHATARNTTPPYQTHRSGPARPRPHAEPPTRPP